jgi:hypothetical protein
LKSTLTLADPAFLVNSKFPNPFEIPAPALIRMPKAQQDLLNEKFTSKEKQPNNEQKGKV